MSEFDDLKKKIELIKSKNKISLSKNNNNIIGLALRISTERFYNNSIYSWCCRWNI